jgi:signal transduction histidine kinase
LRTPLNAIIGFSEMIKDELLGPIENEDYKHYSSDIYSSGNHLLAIINDILDIAKIEAGKMVLDETLLDPALIAEATISLVSGRPEAEGLDISVMREITLPALNADARALKQILLNLLSNAVKFTEQGSVTINIGTAKDGWLFIAVTDTGIGIPKEEIDKLAQPFYQVDSSLAREFEGTGLGLALSRSLVELHDGELSIDSTVGQGTTVTCRFPPPNGWK